MGFYSYNTPFLFDITIPAACVNSIALDCA